MNIKKILQVLRDHKRFLLSTHVNPDPDALCSELALALYLRSIGKKVVIVNADAVPKRFSFLKGAKQIRRYTKSMTVAYDAAVILDCGELNRIGQVQHLLRPDKILVNIDHHITNDRFGQVHLIKPSACSTTEILYELIVKARGAFNKDLATHIYTGLMTDTGSFRYENTTARTHEIAAQLMAHGVQAQKIYQNIYETISFKDLQEVTKLLSRVDAYKGGKLVCVTLTKKILARFSQDFDLRDTLFKFLRSVNRVEVIAIFTEEGRFCTRVNFRSTGKFNVAQLAGYFRGGGHRRASGCTLEKNLTDAKRAVVNRIRTFL